MPFPLRLLDDRPAWLTAEIAALEAALAMRLDALAATRMPVARLLAVSAMDPLTAASLSATLPELRRVAGKAVASLAGVDLVARDSRLMRDRQIIQSGREPVRAVLDMATLLAIQHNRTIRAFYDRLRAAGKAKKLAITACMRKLLVFFNSILAGGTPHTLDNPRRSLTPLALPDRRDDRASRKEA